MGTPKRGKMVRTRSSEFVSRPQIVRSQGQIPSAWLSRVVSFFW